MSQSGMVIEPVSYFLFISFLLFLHFLKDAPPSTTPCPEHSPARSSRMHTCPKYTSTQATNEDNNNNNNNVSDDNASKDESDQLL